MDSQTLLNLIIAFFAAASFVLSFSVFYRQFLLRHDQIACAVDAHGARAGEVTIQFSLSNFGTHAVKLRAAYLSTQLPPTIIDGNGQGTPIIDDPESIPATVIRPGDIHTIHVKWSQSPLDEIRRTEEYRSLSQVWIHVRFIFVTINGRELECERKAFQVQYLKDGAVCRGFVKRNSWVVSGHRFSFLEPQPNLARTRIT